MHLFRRDIAASGANGAAAGRTRADGAAESRNASQSCGRGDVSLTSGNCNRVPRGECRCGTLQHSREWLIGASEARKVRRGGGASAESGASRREGRRVRRLRAVHRPWHCTRPLSHTGCAPRSAPTETDRHCQQPHSETAMNPVAAPPQIRAPFATSAQSHRAAGGRRDGCGWRWRLVARVHGAEMRQQQMSRQHHSASHSER